MDVYKGRSQSKMADLGVPPFQKNLRWICPPSLSQDLSGAISLAEIVTSPQGGPGGFERLPILQKTP